MKNTHFYVALGIIAFIIIAETILIFNSIQTKIVVKKIKEDKKDLEREVKTIGSNYKQLTEHYNVLMNYINNPDLSNNS